MQKEDIQWAVLGVLLLLVIALVIKPMATGEPVNLGLPASPTPTPVPVATQSISPITLPPTQIPTPTSTPTPRPTWDRSTQTLGFVDPAQYGINLNQSIPNATIFPPSDAAIRNTSMATFATFSGQYSGTTQTIQVPFPYWELWYTVDPMTSDLSSQAEVGSVIIVPTTGASESKLSGSYSTALPKFSIEVMDADDPNRIVRSITPPGNIDPKLWSGSNDPRPWKEKFYEGQHRYYFIVRAQILKSYEIELKVPTSYVGKY